MDYQFDFGKLALAKDYLDKHGFVVITNVIPPEEVQEATKLFREEYDTEDCNGFMDVFAHTKFLWYCRTRPTILDVYRCLHGGGDLVTSFDRFSAIANRISEDPEESEAYWLHVDYPLGQHSVPDIYQSFLSLVDSGGGPGKPGFRVVPQSLALLDEVHNQGSGGGTFWQASSETVDRLVDVQKAVRFISSPAGSLTVWKSGIMHDNSTAVTDTNRPCDIARLVVYLCYAPRSWATPHELKQKKQHFRFGQTTTHWPVGFVSLHDNTKHKWDHKGIIREFPMIENLI